MGRIEAIEAVELRPRRRLWRSLVYFVRRKPLGVAGLLIVVFMTLTAIVGPLIAPHDPYTMRVTQRTMPPSREFLLGTDFFGRDLLSRIIYGARVSMAIGFGAALAGGCLGALIGAFSGYLGGRFDIMLQRLMDIMMAFPNLILAMAIVAALGPSTTNVIIAIMFPLVPRAARVVRSSALAIKETQYADAAKAMGCSNVRIVMRHVLPNCMAPFIIILTAQLGAAILVESSLSFIGLGTQEPHASWGLLLAGSAAMFARTAPWLAVFPGVALTLAVFGFNIFGDALRDALDPRLRGT